MSLFQNKERKVIGLRAWEPSDPDRDLSARAIPNYRPERWIDPERMARDVVRGMKPARHSRNKFDYAPQVAPAYVQSAKNTTNSGTSCSEAYGSANTAGNFLVAVACLQHNSTCGLPTITDTRGNMWQLGMNSRSNNNISANFVFYAPNCAAGANTVTVTAQNSSTDIDLIILEYSGMSASVNVVDGASDAVSASNVTSLGTGSITTANANDIVLTFAYIYSSSSPSYSVSSGTLRQQTSNGAGRSGAVWDNIVSATGTYSNTVGVGSAAPLEVGIIAFSNTSLPTKFVQSATHSASTGTTCAPAFTANNTAGNCLVAIVISSYVISNATISDYQTNTWYAVGGVGDGSTRRISVFIAPNCKAGSNTVTATVGGSANTVATILEYTGTVTAHVLDSSMIVDGTFTLTGYVGTANETLLTAFGCQNTAPYTGTLSGYTIRSLNTVDMSLGVYDTAVASPGAYSVTIGQTRGYGCCALIALRTALPTIGYLQAAQAAASSATYIEPNSSGNLLVAVVFDNSPTACTLSDTNGNAWIQAVTELDKDSARGFIFYAPNCSAGANTVSATGGAVQQLMIFEYIGLAQVSPLMSTSVLRTFSGNSSPSGTINTAGTVLLFSAIFDYTGSGNSYTASSGFITRLSQNASSPGMATWDQIVSSPGAYSNTVSSSETITANTACGIVAFSTGAIPFPVIRQRNDAGLNAGADGPVSVSAPYNTVAGNLLVVTTASQAGSSTGTISDTQGNTYTLVAGGGGNLYGVWYAIAKSSASLTVTCTNANCIGVAEVANIKLAQVDQHSVNSNTGSSITTNSITTTHATEIIFAMSFSQGESINLSGLSSGWAGGGPDTSGHSATVKSAYQSDEAAGTYAATLTLTTSQNNEGVIVSFYGSSGTVLPQMQVAC